MSENNEKRQHQQRHNLSLLEVMLQGEDVSASVLSFLDMNSIRHVALCSHTCRSMTNHDALWRALFYRMWSALPDEQTYFKEQGIWKRCFINAYTNEHDLWITHWNCIFPDSNRTSLQPGRCCIPDAGPVCFPTSADASLCSNAEQQFQQMCPTCRYHPALPHANTQISAAIQEELNYRQQGTSATDRHDPIVRAKEHLLQAVQNTNKEATPANIIYYAARYSIAKWCRNIYQLHNNKESLNSGAFLQKTDSQQLQQRARWAFASAASAGRVIHNTDQYRSSGLNFLRDLVFFRIGGQIIEARDRINELVQVGDCSRQAISWFVVCFSCLVRVYFEIYTLTNLYSFTIFLFP